MSNEQHEESGGRVDATSILYIVGGIPAMVAFFVILFLLTRSCGIAA
jgi:hypothetical protein